MSFLLSGKKPVDKNVPAEVSGLISNRTDLARVSLSCPFYSKR